MMSYTFIVTVDVDANHVDAPDVQAIENEIRSNLEWDAHHNGIERINVRLSTSSYRDAVERSLEQ